MSLKGIFINRPASFQMLILISLILIGTLLPTMLDGLIPALLLSDINNNPGILRLYQLMSVTCTYLLPSLLAAFLFSYNFFEYLYIKSFPSLKTTLITFISMFLFFPIIALTGLLNKSMKLPAFMEQIETWMWEMEVATEKITNLLLSGTDWSSVVMNLFVVAIMAAITEELLFRGVFQRIIEKWTVNPHTTIWTVAVIFSAVHLQFYGFIPRLLMGAYFGYLIYWSKNIWLSVLAHFTNNAVAVIGMSTDELKDQMFITGDIPKSEIITFAIPALISFGLFLLCANYLRKRFQSVKGPFF